MAAGLPVITSSQCGAAELLAGHEGGIVCDAQDVAALATAMTRLLDPALRAAMGARARQAVQPLTAEAMAAQLVGLYRSLLGLKTPPRTL
jgi:UDP-glucose:(heptosyl)LPS alpha-1,3-glucosyltransferase